MPRKKKQKVKFKAEFVKIGISRELPPVEKMDMHFFASNPFYWRATNNLKEIFDFFGDCTSHTIDVPWNLYLVPLPSTAKYEIREHKPEVEGVILLGTYYTDPCLEIAPHLGRETESGFWYLNLSESEQKKHLKEWKTGKRGNSKRYLG